MRLIDADELWNSIRNDVAPFNVSMVSRHIHNSSTIDAVSVVRCKDCKYCQYDYLSKRYSCFKVLGFWVRAMIKPTDFCSYGERKGE